MIHAPLDESHLAEINRALASHDMLEAQIQRAKAAGINIGDAETVAKNAKDTLIRIKNVYMPGH